MELLKELGIEPGALLINVFGFLLLLWFMKRFMFGPISHFMAQRAGEIEKQIEDARALHQQAEAERARLQEELDQERQAARDQVARLTQEAKAAIEELQREGKRQRQEMVEQGRQELANSKEVALAELKAQVSDMALDIAARVIREALDSERQAALVDEFVADVRQANHGKKAT